MNQGRNGHEMDKPALVQLRMCAVADCDFTVQNGLTNVDHILRAMSNHIAVTHTASKGVYMHLRYILTLVICNG